MDHNNIKITESLKLFTILSEIILNPDNSAKILQKGKYNGEFKVGEKEYEFNIIKFDNNSYNSDSFYNIQFKEVGNINPDPSMPTGNAREGYISILSTMYKVINDFAKSENPEYIGLSSLDKSGYWGIYNKLSKDNPIEGYLRVNASLPFQYKGLNGKIIVLKRK